MSKTIFKTKLALAATIILLALLPTQSKAQISVPYTIQNAMDCSISVSYTIYTGGGSACVSFGPFTIPKGVIKTLTATDFSGCTPATDIYIALNLIGLNSTSYIGGINAPSGPGTVNLTSVAGCTNASPHANWATTGTVFFK